MRLLSIILLALPAWAQLAITTVDPKAAAGGTQALAASGGTAPYTWSLSPGSVGSIDSGTGLYTAPATVVVNHQAAGCQVFPSASIFSTKISNLPVHASSATWIAQISSTSRMQLAPAYGLNIVTNSTPTYNLVNLYTPTSDGIYPIADFPWLKRQGGYYSHVQSGLDRHIANVNKDTCEFTEMYNTYPEGIPGLTCVNGPCTSNSSARYDGDLFKFQVGAGVDAAGLPLQPVTLKLADFNAGVIRHPMRYTLTNGIIQNNTHVWPATSHAASGGSGAPYGAWLRLKSSFNITGYSAKAQIVLQAWKDYGMLMADGGLNLDVATDADISQDKDVFAAITEIKNTGPQITDFEYINVCVTPGSADCLKVSDTTAEVKHDNSYETPVNFAHACVTDAAMTTVCKYIALRGVTIGTTYTAMTFQAGSSAVQLDSWVTGSANQSVTWAITGTAVGTLTSGGSYTPPATASSPTITMFEGTAAADANAKVQIYVVIWPEGVIRVDAGRDTDFVGSEGTWFKEHGFDGGQGARTNEATNWSGIPADATLYHTMRYIYSNDLQYRWWLSPGNYKITLKWGLWSSLTSHVYTWQNGVVPERNWMLGIDTNGTVVRRRHDIGRAAGTFNTDADLEIPCWVQAGDNGLCYLALRQIADKLTSDPLTKGFCWAGDPDYRLVDSDPTSAITSVTSATNASPIVVGFDIPHQILVGEYIYISNALGNTAANGFWRVSAKTDLTVTLEGSTGNGTYTSGGLGYEIAYGGDPSDDPSACAPSINAIRLEADAGGSRIEIDGDTTDITFSQTRQFGCVGWFIASTCTWQIISGPGSIDSNGLYTAPSAPPTSGSQAVTIRATHSVSTGLTDDHVFNFAFGTIVVSRTATGIYRGQTATFAASINGIAYPSVTWTRSGSQGSINSSGVYSAPGSVSPNETLTVTATSTHDVSKSGNTTLGLSQLRPTLYINASRENFSEPAIDSTDGKQFTDGAGAAWQNDTMAGDNNTVPTNAPWSLVRTSTESQTISFATTVNHGPGCDANDITNRKLMYLTQRYDYQTETAPWGWIFTLPNGRYNVRLKFLTPNASIQYIQDITVQGVLQWNDLNTFALTGGQNYCADLETEAVVVNGNLTITFVPVVGGGGTIVSGVVLTDLGPIVGNTSIFGNAAITGNVVLLP